MSKDYPTLDEKLSLSLVKCRVRCLVLGGVACNIYGSTRMSEDAVIRFQNETGKLDAFYAVNGIDDFEAAWTRSSPWDESLRVLSVPDLIKTKTETGRPRDQEDIRFLEKLPKPL